MIRTYKTSVGSRSRIFRCASFKAYKRRLSLLRSSPARLMTSRTHHGDSAASNQSTNSCVVVAKSLPHRKVGEQDSGVYLNESTGTLMISNSASLTLLSAKCPRNSSNTASSDVSSRLELMLFRTPHQLFCGQRQPCVLFFLMAAACRC